MKTKYQIVREYIEENIKNKTYRPNEKIESESMLMKRFGVSRHTVRIAIGDLVSEGKLYREQGAGTFCADYQADRKEETYRSKRIAIITTYISDYIFPSIIRGAESKLSEAGYEVSIFSTNNSHEKEKSILESILTQNFNGLIIEPTKSAYPNPNLSYYLQLDEQKIPYVMINEYYDVIDPPHVVVDDVNGGYLQADHLIQENHQHIIGMYKVDDKQGTKRLKGFIDAHREHQVKLNPEHIVTYTTEEKETVIKEKLESLLLKDPSITAIACYNDELAMNVLDTLRTLNKQIPKDISIVGFDDSFLADISEVKLTSITHPKAELGEVAAEKIVELIKETHLNKESDVKSVNFSTELVKRTSTKSI